MISTCYLHFFQTAISDFPEIQNTVNDCFVACYETAIHLFIYPYFSSMFANVRARYCSREETGNSKYWWLIKATSRDWGHKRTPAVTLFFITPAPLCCSRPVFIFNLECSNVFLFFFFFCLKAIPHYSCFQARSSITERRGERGKVKGKEEVSEGASERMNKCGDC